LDCSLSISRHDAAAILLLLFCVRLSLFLTRVHVLEPFVPTCVRDRELIKRREHFRSFRNHSWREMNMKSSPKKTLIISIKNCEVFSHTIQ